MVHYRGSAGAAEVRVHGNGAMASTRVGKNHAENE